MKMSWWSAVCLFVRCCCRCRCVRVSVCLSVCVCVSVGLSVLDVGWLRPSASTLQPTAKAEDRQTDRQTAAATTHHTHQQTGQQERHTKQQKTTQDDRRKGQQEGVSFPLPPLPCPPTPPHALSAGGSARERERASSGSIFATEQTAKSKLQHTTGCSHTHSVVAVRYRLLLHSTEPPTLLSGLLPPPLPLPSPPHHG